MHVHPEKLEGGCLRQGRIYQWLRASLRKAISQNTSVREVRYEPTAPTSSIVEEPRSTYRPGPGPTYRSQPALADDFVYPVGSRLGLVPPKGMVPSASSAGLQHTSTETSIIMTLLPHQAHAPAELRRPTESPTRPGNTAAAATPGPARAPRPASSIPAMQPMPNDRSFFSCRNPQRILDRVYPH